MSYTITTKKSWSVTQSDLAIEFERWGVNEWDTDYPRGARYEGHGQSEIERTVNLVYKKDGKTIKLSMGKQDRAVDNLRVLFLAIKSMRLNEKRGIGEVLQSAYLQLEAPQVFDPYQYLGVYQNSPLEVIEAVYKARALKAHPDTSEGSEHEMQKLNQAIEIIRLDKKA